MPCACVDRDSLQCAAIRYGMDHWGEPCECPCHQYDDEDDDYPEISGAPLATSKPIPDCHD